MSAPRMSDLPADVRAIVAAALAAERAARIHKPGAPASAVSGEMSAPDRPAPGHHPGRRAGSGSEAAA